MSTHTETCPNCSDAMPVVRGFVTWCDKCNWNAGIDEGADNSHENLFWRTHRKLSRVKGEELLRYVTSRPKSFWETAVRASNWRWFLVVGTYLTLFVATVLSGFLLVIFFWSSPLLLLVGLALLGLGWIIRPRLEPSPQTYETRENIPELYALSEAVADKMGAARPAFICINEDFNASVYQAGRARLPVLTIGLPLWMILSKEQKVALLAHEFAHITCGDPARGLWVGASYRALNGWLSVLDTSQGDIYSVLGRILFLPLTLFFRGLEAALSRACFVESQIAEYRSDLRACTVAGTDAVESLLHMLKFEKALGPFLNTMSGGIGVDGIPVIERFRSLVVNLPEREKLRLERCALNGDTSVDASHPPTQSRLAFIKSFEKCLPQISLSGTHDAAIDAELEAFVPSLSERLFSKYV